MRYKVTLTCYRETWSGRDSLDGDVVHIVEAENEKTAIKKAKEKEFNPGGGKAWSHSRWAQRVKVEKA